MKVAAVLGLVIVAGCAATIPQTELDRCTIGIADGNSAMTMRQGPACALVGRRYAADNQTAPAIEYARKACDLQDARGCEDYLTLARGNTPEAAGELSRARTEGERACSGMVISADGADERPLICARTADLYLMAPSSSQEDAGRLFARACRLGDTASCTRARSMGVDSTPANIVRKGTPPPAPVAQSPPPPLPHNAIQAPPPMRPACHEMRACVTLEVEERNITSVIGTLTNRCGRAVTCTWCAASGNRVDKAGCHTASIDINDSRVGREAGLYYDGFDSIAYDCMDADDPRVCLGL